MSTPPISHLILLPGLSSCQPTYQPHSSIYLSGIRYFLGRLTSRFLTSRHPPRTCICACTCTCTCLTSSYPSPNSLPSHPGLPNQPYTSPASTRIAQNLLASLLPNPLFPPRTKHTWPASHWFTADLWATETQETGIHLLVFRRLSDVFGVNKDLPLGSRLAIKAPFVPISALPDRTSNHIRFTCTTTGVSQKCPTQRSAISTSRSSWMSSRHRGLIWRRTASMRASWMN